MIAWLADMPDYSEAMTGLMARERQLMREITIRNTELTRIRGAISGLRMLISGGQPRGTYEIIGDYSETLEPGTVIRLTDLMRYADSHGWSSKTTDRRQTMAGALAQMAAKGQAVRRIGHGKYRTLIPAESNGAHND